MLQSRRGGKLDFGHHFAFSTIFRSAFVKLGSKILDLFLAEKWSFILLQILVRFRLTFLLNCSRSSMRAEKDVVMYQNFTMDRFRTVRISRLAMMQLS